MRAERLRGSFSCEEKRSFILMEPSLSSPGVPSRKWLSSFHLSPGSHPYPGLALAVHEKATSPGSVTSGTDLFMHSRRPLHRAVMHFSKAPSPGPALLVSPSCLANPRNVSRSFVPACCGVCGLTTWRRHDRLPRSLSLRELRKSLFYLEVEVRSTYARAPERY